MLRVILETTGDYHLLSRYRAGGSTAELGVKADAALQLSERRCPLGTAGEARPLDGSVGWKVCETERR